MLVEDRDCVAALEPRALPGQRDANGTPDRACRELVQQATARNAVNDLSSCNMTVATAEQRQLANTTTGSMPLTQTHESLSQAADAAPSAASSFEPLSELPLPLPTGPHDAPEFLLAMDRGLLLMSSRALDALGVATESVDLPQDDPCLSPLPPLRWLLRHAVGYDAAVLSAMLDATAGAGYVLAIHSGETHALSHAASLRTFFARGWDAWLLLRLGTVCSAVFLLFAASALVSFILAQTQKRMLRFTVALQRHVQARLPLLPLVAAHLADSLVFVPIMLGVLFFLFEFFADQLLAFLLLLVVWLSELWSITACRTVGSIRVFPRLFGLLVTWFNVYYLSYPFGYQYMALACVALALATAAFHLWHVYELPALLEGRISPRQLRSEAVSLIMRVRTRRYLPRDRTAEPVQP